MAVLKNRAGVTTATTGTGAITLGSALGAATPVNQASWQTFGAAGVANADSVRYLILDSNGAWEYGPGVYTAAGTSLARATGAMDGTVQGQKSSTSALLNLSGTAQVFIAAVAEDIAAAIAASKLLGRGASSGAGPGEEIALGTGLSMTGTTLNASGGGLVNIIPKTFAVAGSTLYTPTPGTKFVGIKLVGGGGGGGGVGDTSGTHVSAGGGGSGGYSEIVLPVASVSPNINVTVGAAGTAGTSGGGTGGAGGNTFVGATFGTAICAATGGAGGLGQTTAPYTGGAGGVIAGAVGDVVAAGSPGANGSNLVSTSGGIPIGVYPAGNGGTSFFGGGGRGGTIASNGSAVGVASSNYGSGGGGAMGLNVATNRAGGAGSAGFVHITEYL